MEEKVKQFKEVFKPLYEKGLPFFGDHNGKLFSKEEYNFLLTEARMDHSKFEDLEKHLQREAIVNKLSNDFNILDQFKVIKSNFPPISFSSCVELKVLVKEMMEYEIPPQNCWDQIDKFGKMKYTTYPS